MKRLVIIVATTVVAAYAALMIALFVMQRGLLFPAPTSGRAPQHTPLVRFDSGVALYRPVPTGAVTVVHFHGNAEQIAELEWLDRVYKDAGLGFFAPEYPGYGLLAQHGSPSETSLIAAALRAVEHLENHLGVPRAMMVLEGQSLGSGVAVQLAAKGYGTRLILLTPYTSIADVATCAFPFAPGFLVRDPFDSAALAPGLQLPVLIVHGTNDEVIPFELGKALAAKFPHSTFVPVARAGHNDVWDRPEIVGQITAFARGN